MYALKAVAHAADLTTRSLKPTAALTVASMAPVTKELLQSIGATRVAAPHAANRSSISADYSRWVGGENSS